MDPLIQTLLQNGHSARLVSFSALDRFCGLRPAPYRYAETDADLAGLARIFDALRFPGTALADAAVDGPDERGEPCVWYLRCVGDEAPPPSSFGILDFAWDGESKKYLDPADRYPVLRSLRDAPKEGSVPAPWLEEDDPAPGVERWRAAADAALVYARYRADGVPQKTAAARLARLPDSPLLSPEEQRALLSLLLVSRRPEAGLGFLKRLGFVDAHWPLLAALDDVDHSKEFHPEGNVWAHTMETFRYRKIADLTLSLGLLFHDSGKPLSEASGGRRFDRHAELGAAAARRFLAERGFAPALVDGVDFLVRHHMMPAALPRLPLTRTQAALESPLFPLLLELYRCDEESSFKGPEGFYESSAAYRGYLKNVKNPYRSADGKKLMRLLFEREGKA